MQTIAEKPLRNPNVSEELPIFSLNEELLERVMNYQHYPLIERMSNTFDLLPFMSPVVSRVLVD